MVGAISGTFRTVILRVIGESVLWAGVRPQRERHHARCQVAQTRALYTRERDA